MVESIDGNIAPGKVILMSTKQIQSVIWSIFSIILRNTVFDSKFFNSVAFWIKYNFNKTIKKCKIPNYLTEVHRCFLEKCIEFCDQFQDVFHLWNEHEKTNGDSKVCDGHIYRIPNFNDGICFEQKKCQWCNQIIFHT